MSSGRDFETGYQALGSYLGEEDPEGPPSGNIVHVVPDKNKARWNHVEDLDEFFTRVYQYYQRSGFACMVLQDILQLIQFMFVVLFSVFLMKCVDYDTLFNEKPQNVPHKVNFADAIYPVGQCVARFDPIIVICLIVAFMFWLFRFIKVIYNTFKYYEIRAFFTQALKIPAGEIGNMTWHEVQLRIIEVQKEQQMCIHKQELTELDIYHRILRFKNYMIAMTNKSLLPNKRNLPFFGDYVFLSTGLKYNLEIILFWGPCSPFENNWHLKPDYRSYHKRKELAESMSKRILWIGIANFVLCPLIFLWQILYSFFRYAEILKREPGALGSRRWSLYARLYLRHFNELDHEFNARLNRAYRPAERYMNSFTTPILVLLAKHTAFFAGSIFAVFIILTVVDEDFLAVQHVIATMTILGIVMTLCRSVIPDEHMVWCPELLMKNMLAQIHYMPDHWKGNAHTSKVRDEFSLLFHYKVLYLFEELFSPIITPFVLCFGVRNKAQEIVDFYRNFTVEVTGVGDVCSFAQMDIRKHGNPQWTPESHTEANQYQQAEDGKTELSLMHFTLTNPAWKPKGAESMFIHHLKEQVQRDANTMSLFPGDNPLINSLHSLSSIGYGYNSMITSMTAQSPYPNQTSLPQSPNGASAYSHNSDPTPSMGASAMKTGTLSLRGGLRNTEGPPGGTPSGLLASINTAGNNQLSFARSVAPDIAQASSRGVTEETCTTEMSFSALYLHELHQRRILQPGLDTMAEMQELGMWKNQPDSQASEQDSTQASSHTRPEAGGPEAFDHPLGQPDYSFVGPAERPTGLLRAPFGQSPPMGSMQPPPSLGPIFSNRLNVMPNIQEHEEDRSTEHQPLLDADEPPRLFKSS